VGGKRLLERWLDQLFTALYQDLMCSVIWSAQVYIYYIGGGVWAAGCGVRALFECSAQVSVDLCRCIGARRGRGASFDRSLLPALHNRTSMRSRTTRR
jgi:hypothetical protein